MPHTYPVAYRRGLNLPLPGLWIDARTPQPVAVVSHAHGDHVAAHDAVVCTAATWAVMRARSGTRRARRSSAHVLDWGERWECGDATVSLHAAGHVLGSAQVLVEHRGLRVLYSGDLRVRASRTAEPLQRVAADLLIVEATYGRPHFVFPPRDEVVDRICAWCRRCLDQGRIPVLLAYSFGKGQELMACLAEAGMDLLVHPMLHDVASVYRTLGVDLPEARRLGEGPVSGAVVIWPPHLRGSRRLRALGEVRTAYISGWALDPQARSWMGADAAFPLTDHAGFDELCDYVQGTGARLVYTLHGYADDLAHQLSRRGHDARPLARTEQLRLALA